jgi:hypothetical protein
MFGFASVALDERVDVALEYLTHRLCFFHDA